jgi:NitT/TauT family transport system ATP-binding protein
VVQALFLAQRPTVVLITHDLREAVYLADRVLVMGRCRGRIIEDSRIELPRPRSEETLFAAHFSRYVLHLRNSIGRAMQQ